MGARRLAAEGAIGVLLLVSGVILSSAIPPSFLVSGGGVSTTTQASPPSFLAVLVLVQDSAGVLQPVRGDLVGLTQQASRGLRVPLATNASGEVEVPAIPGAYGVSVTDVRFKVQTTVQVTPNTLTEVRVSANRTSYTSQFADAQDLTGVGVVEPWETLTVALASLVFTGRNGSLGPGLVLYSGASFPSVVFVQGLRCCDPVTGISPLGPEVPATVLSQSNGSGFQWLELRPTQPLEIRGASLFSVATYAANVTVTRQDV